MSVSVHIGGPTPFKQIQHTCPQLSLGSYIACTKMMSKLASKTSEAIMNLFGGISEFCQLPELPFEDCKMGGTEYLDLFRGQDLCASVMRGVDSSQRPFVTFGVQQVAADPETHQPLYIYGHATAFTLFQRFANNADSWMSAGNSIVDMLPLRTAKRQYVDDEGKRKGSLEQLEQLLAKGFLVQSEKSVEVDGKKLNLELHLATIFNQVTPMCPKDEL